MYTITVNEGPLSAEDNAVYFCHEEAQFSVHVIPISDTHEERLVFVDYLPMNGRDAGSWHKVPFSRIVSIVENDR